MALLPPPAVRDKKRVKVYELRNNDWFDRGTGFCTGHVVNDESKIFVESEDQPDRILLETQIRKDDGYQKQQETLIVWSESNGPDMALSFQEADGCASIWEFVSQIQQNLITMNGLEDTPTPDAMEGFPHPVMLPPAELANLPEIDAVVRNASTSQQGRESLLKLLLNEDYIRRLASLTNIAERQENLPDLHRLSTVIKAVILLNDNHIIERVVSDDVIFGVVGALEYDPDFPSHKANHRQYLQDKSRFKEVVPIEDPAIAKKIHATWRLQYLKDVVLARILDDPTFSVLNSLIFYNQVEIVHFVQSNGDFLKELFSLIDGAETTAAKRKDAVYFLQQCCAIAKNLQANARQSLYTNFIQNGLLNVIVFALGQEEAPIRIAGTDILVAMIDHDPGMVRAHIFKAITEKKTPLTDTLIDLLLVEDDLGVKAQAADAIKVLLDPQQAQQAQQAPPQDESFIQDFYDNGAKKLFQPLKDLEKRPAVTDLSFSEVSLYCHLVDILMYFVRQHLYLSKFFIASEAILARVRQLLGCPQKHMKLTALKFFRTCLSLQDEFYYQQLIQNNVFGPIIDIVYETLPRDNLLNSACLDLFEYVKRDPIRPVIVHVVETYRQRLQDLTYVGLFEELILRYDQMAQGYNMDGTLLSQEDPMRDKVNGNNQRWPGMREMDPEEEQYFNTSDDEDEISDTPKILPSLSNGAGPLAKPLVDYPDDDFDDEDGIGDAPPLKRMKQKTESRPSRPSPEQAESPPMTDPPSPQPPPPERLSEKRRREDDEEDELGKLTATKRRSSSSASSVGGNASAGFLRRKDSFANGKETPPPGKKIAISLAVNKTPIGADRGGGESGG